jgi:hypothetical protein
MAGLGTTGVLIASFFMLLTVGSTLVAFNGVPGVASNGDLSSIELTPQEQQAERDRETLLAATNLFGDRATGPEAERAAANVFDELARDSGAGPAGQIRSGGGSTNPDSLTPGRPTSPLIRPPTVKTPGSNSGSGVLQTPVTPTTGGDATPGTGTGTGTGTDTGTGTGTDTGTGTGTDTGTGTGTDTGTGTGTDTGTGTGTDTGTGTGTGTGTDTGTGTGTDTGTGTGTDTGTGGTDTGTGTVGDTAGTVGDTVGGGTGQAVGDTGAAAGGLVDDVTTVVGGLTGT